MALSIPKLSEQILLMYTGGRPTDEGIDVRIIEAWVQQALDAAIGEQFLEEYRVFGTHTTSSFYHVPIIVKLSVDQSFDGKVAVLPEYVVLPKDKGLAGVSWGRGYSNNLTYIKFQEWNALKKGGLLAFNGGFFYSILNQKLIVRGDCAADKLPYDEVMITAVTADNATIDDSMALVITSKVLAIMNIQFRSRPDMISDQNPAPTA